MTYQPHHSEDVSLKTGNEGTVPAAVPADLKAWEKARFGVFHSDGRFEELPVEGWEDHPLAHTARWAGGMQDMQVLRAALATSAPPPVEARASHQRFEVWADDQGFPLSKLETFDGFSYVDLRTQGAWDAWQACDATHPKEPTESREANAEGGETEVNDAQR